MFNVKFELTEEDARKAVGEEVKRRIRERIPHYYSPVIEEQIKEKIKTGVNLEIESLDLSSLIKEEIGKCLEKILQDAVRRQIKDIVRLAVYKELQAQKAEFEPNSQDVE